MVEVQEDSRGRYVEFEGKEFESRDNDLPRVGTSVEISTYTGLDDCAYADAWWDADTQSGQAYALLKER